MCFQKQVCNEQIQCEGEGDSNLIIPNMSCCRNGSIVNTGSCVNDGTYKDQLAKLGSILRHVAKP